MTRQTWLWLALSTSTLVSAIALRQQLAFERRLAERVETRELVVRERPDGPAIKAKASADTATLTFTDGSAEPLTLGYKRAPTDRRFGRPGTRLAIQVEPERASITAASAGSRAIMSADRTDAGMSLTDGRGDGARVTASPAASGFQTWMAARHGHSSADLVTTPDGVQLSMATPAAAFEAAGTADGTATMNLSFRSANAPGLHLRAAKDGSSMIMRDGDGQVPIELSSGPEGKIRLAPGREGCVQLNERSGC